MREVAVVDRIVDGEQVVLLVGPEPQREVIAPIGDLPDDVREGHWLKVELDGDRVVRAEIDHGATERARDRVTSKLDALRQRGRRLR
jgi:hypothetical protein